MSAWSYKGQDDLTQGDENVHQTRGPHTGLHLPVSPDKVTGSCDVAFTCESSRAVGDQS